MLSSSEMQTHIKVADIIPTEYSDFLTYCGIAGKTFSDEITPVDYVAYRSQFGHEKKEVKKLRSIIEGGLSLKKTDSETELSVNLREKSETVDITDDKKSDIGL